MYETVVDPVAPTSARTVPRFVTVRPISRDSPRKQAVTTVYRIACVSMEGATAELATLTLLNWLISASAEWSPVGLPSSSFPSGLLVGAATSHLSSAGLSRYVDRRVKMLL
eukprot:CAMPEP_0173318304 /NCGR_PEP_ID=MMETSP1143-20121109/27584_1 /TAXON_ID=483371 /ORGANISM="non described non described, Strain CCMP2298" /LENGTH=110 /DNA_ID=CAMNT_0014261537 /DNA_START=98 /DNA_END=427 /DNA_ORIENTATION=-